jgi:hypothetical protein
MTGWLALLVDFPRAKNGFGGNGAHGVVSGRYFINPAAWAVGGLCEDFGRYGPLVLLHGRTIARPAATGGLAPAQTLLRGVALLAARRRPEQ